MSDFWDDEELQVENRVRLDRRGDSVDGEILAMDKATFGGALSREGGPVRTVPKLTLLNDVDGEEWILIAGAIELRQKLTKSRPEVGDRIHVEVTGVEKLSGRGAGPRGEQKEQKHFAVEVTRKHS